MSLLLLFGGSPQADVIGSLTLSDAAAADASLSDGLVGDTSLSDALLGDAMIVDSSP